MTATENELRGRLLATRSVLAAVIGLLDANQEASVLRVLHSLPREPRFEGLGEAALNEFVNIQRWIIEGSVPREITGLE
ncbi:hypothetical protein [Candidatus Poriferisodalis sp.]|uniref:hypothetical protein n=1 Tax=Candidatus Poriferisodalis sp. TaxID=3101277 RepID=UPI003C704073